MDGHPTGRLFLVAIPRDDGSSWIRRCLWESRGGVTKWHGHWHYDLHHRLYVEFDCFNRTPRVRSRKHAIFERWVQIAGGNRNRLYMLGMDYRGRSVASIIEIFG